MNQNNTANEEEQSMTRRAYGGLVTAALTSGPIIIGRSKDHTIGSGSMVDEFKGTSAEVVKTRPWGYYIEVSGVFEESVTNESVTVSFNRSDQGRNRETITERTFTVSGETFSRTFRLWNLPDIAAFSRGSSGDQDS